MTVLSLTHFNTGSITRGFISVAQYKWDEHQTGFLIPSCEIASSLTLQISLGVKRLSAKQYDQLLIYNSLREAPWVSD